VPFEAECEQSYDSGKDFDTKIGCSRLHAVASRQLHVCFLKLNVNRVMTRVKTLTLR